MCVKTNSRKFGISRQSTLKLGRKREKSKLIKIRHLNTVMIMICLLQLGNAPTSLPILRELVMIQCICFYILSYISCSDKPCSEFSGMQLYF